jgi:histidinol-phosphate aminotransferase
MSWRTLLRDELRDLEGPVPAAGPGTAVRLDGNESPYPLAPDLFDALARQLAAVALHRYPDASATRAREACAGWLGVPADSICLGNGSDELLSTIVQTFGKPRRGEARARVAYPVPTFPAYRVAAVAGGALPLEMPLRDDFTLDAAALERHVTGGKPNVMFLARPNNPTGTLWEREVIERFVERHPDLVVVIDEAYGDYAGESMIDLVPRRENLVVLKSLSAIGLAGLRAGVLAGNPELVAEVHKVRLPFNVAAWTQRAVAFLVGEHAARLRERCDQIVAERDRLYAALVEGRRGQVLPSRANFLLVRVADADATAQALLEHGVIVRNVSRPGPLRGCLRVTIGTPEENATFLGAFNEAVAPAAPPAPEPEREEKQTDETEEVDAD